MAQETIIFALVRTEHQIEEVKQMSGVTPVRGDLTNLDMLRAVVVDNQGLSRPTTQRENVC